MPKLDAYQQKAVYADTNTVVTAGAGSGKTTVLAERFVHLVASGRAAVDGILTLTFTRKAAAEMYERIYRQLIQRARDEDEPQRKALLERAVRDFDSAHISTLDSFCAQIVRGGSIRFGVAGDFRQDEHSAALMVEESALSFLLSHSDHPALERIVQDFGSRAVLERLLIPLAAREFHLAVEHDFEAMLERQFEYMQQQARSLAEKMQAVQDWFLTEDLPAKPSVQKVVAALRPLPAPASVAAAQEWPRLADICETKVSKWGGKTTDPLLIEAKDRVGQWQTAVKQLGPILMLFQNRQLYRRLYSLLNEYQREIHAAKRSSGVLTFRDVVEMAVTLLQEDLQLRAHYKSLFTHIMIDEFQDNNDLQRRLLFLLAERPELGRTDGAPRPEELESGKLFFVGDEKQSIYRFRGADVRVLKQLQTQMEAAGGESLQLPNNYRSHSGLIQFFNSLFAEVMQPAGKRTGDIAAAETAGEGVGFEADFIALAAPIAHRAFSPKVRLLYKPYDREDDGDDEEALHSKEAEAWYIVNYLKEMIENGRLPVRDKSKPSGAGEPEPTRPATYDDVAILMRSSGNQISFERYMRHLQIPYTVQSTRSLFLEAPINDMYQFLQLVLYPYDSLAYAALLRSPFMNLSDEVAARILRTPEPAEPPETVETAETAGSPEQDGRSAALRAFCLHGDEDLFGQPQEARKYKRAAEVYRVLQELAATAPIEEMIRYLWFEAGYRYVVLRNPDYHAYLEFYDALIELARRSDRRGEGLSGFLDFIRSNLGQYEKLEDLEIIPRRTGGVNLMSIHKSKGLEFPVVIVADMGNSGNAGGDGNLYLWDEEFGLALSGGERGSRMKSYFAEAAREVEERQDYAELKRLLYVACTRAEDHLILSGYHHSKNRNLEKSSGRNVLLNITLQALGWDGAGAVEELTPDSGCSLEFIPDVSEETIEQSRSGGGSRSIPAAVRRFDSAEKVQRSYPQRELTAVEINRRYLESQSAAHSTAESAAQPGGGEALPAIAVDQLLADRSAAAPFGELVHRMIEYRLSGVPGRVPLPALFTTLEPQQAAEIEAEAEQMAEAFLDSPLGREALAAVAAGDGRLESELPFLLRIGSVEGGEMLVRGQIDLLLQREAEVLIIDFKTDRTCRPAEYAAQMAVYRQAAGELYGRPARSVLVYVRGARVEEVSTEVELAELVEG
ncbi:MAG: UvrD-helicase domain-containing protein [Spirochaetota bacterium]